MERIKFLSNLIKGYRCKYIFALILTTIVAPVPLFNNYLIKIIIDDVIGAGKTNLLLPLLSLLLGLTVAMALIWYYARYTAEYISQTLILNLRMQGFSKILSLNFGYFDRTKTGSIMTLMTADLDIVRSFVAYTVFTMIENFIVFVGALAVMLRYADISFIIMIVLVLPVIAYVAIRLAIEIKPCYVRIREMRGNLNTVAEENIGANRVVKAFCREEFENEKLKYANGNFRSAQYSANKVWRKYMPGLSNTVGLFIVYNIIFGGIMVINGSLTLGDLVMFNGMVWMLTGPLTQVGFIINDSASFIASLDKVIELLHTTPEIKNDFYLTDKTVIDGKFEFRNASFNYNKEGAICNLNFTVQKGQKVAIVGPTGSGKSTIVNLISRFYDVDQGLLLVDDINIHNINLDVIRRSIAVAQQDVFLFSETVAANIAYGRTAATMDEIIEAAKVAKAHDFICRLPNGYDTIIGERGVGLSGGQKQRLTLARALLKNPSVLVLDDTTSALDSKTERYIQSTLKEHFHNKTVFIISQRIASVKDCDVIIVLDDGKICEMGTHEELLNNRGYYYNVFKRQYDDFKVNNSEVTL